MDHAGVHPGRHDEHLGSGKAARHRRAAADAARVRPGRRDREVSGRAGDLHRLITVFAVEHHRADRSGQARPRVARGELRWVLVRWRRDVVGGDGGVVSDQEPDRQLRPCGGLQRAAGLCRLRRRDPWPRNCHGHQELQHRRAVQRLRPRRDHTLRRGILRLDRGGHALSEYGADRTEALDRPTPRDADARPRRRAQRVAGSRRHRPQRPGRPLRPAA